MSFGYQRMFDLQKQHYGRVVLSGEYIAECRRRAQIDRDKRFHLTMQLNKRLGLNEKQIRRVLRRVPTRPGAFVQALRYEMAATALDIKREVERIEAYHELPWWQRLIARWLRG